MACEQIDEFIEEVNELISEGELDSEDGDPLPLIEQAEAIKTILACTALLHGRAATGPINRRERLGGLLSFYHREAGWGSYGAPTTNPWRWEVSPGSPGRVPPARRLVETRKTSLCTSAARPFATSSNTARMLTPIQRRVQRLPRPLPVRRSIAGHTQSRQTRSVMADQRGGRCDPTLYSAQHCGPHCQQDGS